MRYIPFLFLLMLQYKVVKGDGLWFPCPVSIFGYAHNTHTHKLPQPQPQLIAASIYILHKIARVRLYTRRACDVCLEPGRISTQVTYTYTPK